MRFGVHVSIANKLYLAAERAVERGCEAMQIFSGSPRNWQKLKISPHDVEEFKRRRKRAQIEPLVLHLPYLVNLSSPNKRTSEGSIELLAEAVKRASSLDASLVVFHTGSHKGEGKQRGLLKLVEMLKNFFAAHQALECDVLLENTAGSGDNLGSTFAELGFILDKAKAPRLGVCFDTAHGFASGYDVSTARGLEETLDEFEQEIGLDKLRLLHANDSKTPCGSKVDRHQHIGQGFIGLEGFRRMVNHPKLKALPCILETPGMKKEDDIRNLEVIKGLVR